ILAAIQPVSASGSYGLVGFSPYLKLPPIAYEADGPDEVRRRVRDPAPPGVLWPVGLPPLPEPPADRVRGRRPRRGAAPGPGPRPPRGRRGEGLHGELREASHPLRRALGCAH